jgi:hypothetical protein
MISDMRKNRRILLLIKIAQVNGWHKPYMRWAARWELKVIRFISSARKRAAHNKARTPRGV